MNPESGRIYRTTEEIEAARSRGEPIVQVSERVADAVEIGSEVLNRAERRLRAREERRAAKRARRGAQED